MSLQQSSTIFNKMRNYNNQVFMLLFNWILCSTILIKCFTGLLLNTYFIRNPTLTANTLEDIVYNPDISVAGKFSLAEIKSSRPELFEILKQKVIDYENKLGVNTLENANSIFNQKLINDVMNRKAVILVSLKDY